MKHILCFHLFNDYSGSPKVLSSILKKMADNGISVDLVTSHGNGALSSLGDYRNITCHEYSYSFSENKFIAFFRYFIIQIYLFVIALSIVKKDTVLYINTILPVGAAIAGRFAGKRIVYHYHENAFVKSTFYRILAKIMQLLASDIICVSDYQKSFLKRQNNVYTVYNALPEEFLKKLNPDSDRGFGNKKVLMLASLKIYKGIYEFIELAKELPQFSFDLILNENQANVDQFIIDKCTKDFRNLMIYPRQVDVSKFYNRGSIVLNLSNKKFIIETFGLTALEAMAAGLPVIVPTEGGIAELVEDGENGYKIDVQDLDKIKETIIKILSDKVLYKKLSSNALNTVKKYSLEQTSSKIKAVLFKND